MGALLGIVAIVGVVIALFLWRLLRVQETRAHVEAVGAATQLARDFTEWYAKGFEVARSQGRLIEWFDHAMRTLKADDDEARFRLHTSAGDDIRPLLVAESFERGLPCRFLDENDFGKLYSGHPGPEPKPISWCPENSCDREHDVSLPAGIEMCPFCGQEAEPFDTESEFEERRRQWRAEMQAFERYRRLFPQQANAEEEESVRAHAAAEQRDRARYEASVAAHGRELNNDQVDVDMND